MGLFDYVKCEVELPDGFKGELQTKDIDDPYMLTHRITAEGRLMQSHLVRIDVVPLEERDCKDPNDIRSFAGSQRHITEERDANFHGWFNFYGSEMDGGKFGEFHEYDAKFTDGQLVEIRLRKADTPCQS